jgi:hypothetical protein
MEIWRQFAMKMAHMRRRGEDGNRSEEVEAEEESGEIRNEGGEEGEREAEINEIIERDIDE